MAGFGGARPAAREDHMMERITAGTPRRGGAHPAAHPVHGGALRGVRVPVHFVATATDAPVYPGVLPLLSELVARAKTMEREPQPGSCHNPLCAAPAGRARRLLFGATSERVEAPESPRSAISL